MTRPGPETPAVTRATARQQVDSQPQMSVQEPQVQTSVQQTARYLTVKCDLLIGKICRNREEAHDLIQRCGSKRVLMACAQRSVGYMQEIRCNRNKNVIFYGVNMMNLVVQLYRRK